MCVCVSVCVDFHSTTPYLSGLGSPAGLLNSTDLLLQPEVGLLEMTDLLDQPADVLQVAEARAQRGVSLLCLERTMSRVTMD